MKLEFREWVAQEGIGGYLKGALGGIGNIATQAMDVPGLDELGANTHSVGNAVNTAFSLAKGAYSSFTALTPEQIKAAKVGCYYNRSLDNCKLLCKKTGDKQACGKLQINPIA
jgi:hypothetical protein